MTKIHKKYRYLGSVHDNIPQGWKPILYEFISDIDKLARKWWIPRWFMNFWYDMSFNKRARVRIKNKWFYNRYEKLFRKRVFILQIKEKFGSLRLYTSGKFPFLELETAYENLSYKICQKCGSTDNVETRNISGWFTTLCSKCYENKTKELQ